jgi:hypothetical protein
MHTNLKMMVSKKTCLKLSIKFHGTYWKIYLNIYSLLFCNYACLFLPRKDLAKLFFSTLWAIWASLPFFSYNTFSCNTFRSYYSLQASANILFDHDALVSLIFNMELTWSLCWILHMKNEFFVSAANYGLLKLYLLLRKKIC